MKIVDTIKLLLRIKKAVEEIKQKAKQEVKMNNQIKPGWQTTEFWLIVITHIKTIVEALQGKIDPLWATIILAVVDCVYAILRTYAKKNG